MMLKINLTLYADYSNRVASGDMTLDEIKQLLRETNEEFDTNLSIPDNILNAMITVDNTDDIENFLINQNLLSRTSVEQVGIFVDEVYNSTFDESIVKYEEVVTASDISDTEFIHADNTASTLKIINDEQPDTFVSDGNSLKTSKAASKWKCLYPYVLWVAALIALIGGCATVFLCVIAIVNLGIHTIKTAEASAPYM